MTLMRRHELVRPDARLAYWTAGRPGSPTVVVLHGATLDHRSWEPQVDALRSRYRFVALDLRGHGESTGEFSFDAAVHDVIALLDHVGLEQVVLMGLSLGGNIAQELVLRQPQRVAALISADSTCNTAARHPLAVSVGVATLTAHAMLLGERFALDAAKATGHEPHVQEYALQVNAHRSNTETVRILTSLLTSALRPVADYHLPVPTLLITGELDRIGDIADGTAAWAEREPLAEHIVIANAGHASNLDNPQAFTAAVADFLDRVLPGRLHSSRSRPTPLSGVLRRLHGGKAGDDRRRVPRRGLVRPRTAQAADHLGPASLEDGPGGEPRKLPLTRAS